MNKLGLALVLVSLSLPLSSVRAQPEEEDEDLEANEDDDEEKDDDTDGAEPESPVRAVTPTGAGATGSAAPDTAAGPEAENAASAPLAEKKSNKGDEGVSLGGRVFVRDTITRLHTDGSEVQNDFALASVRGNIDLRKYGWLRTSIEVSFEDSGEIDLEDVFAELELADEVRFTAGRFKRPISPIALESAWSLPMTERGLLSDNVLVADISVPLNLGGRSEGAMLTYRGRQSVKPRAYVGLFNARLPKQLGGGAQLIDLADNPLRDVYSRVEAELIDGFEVGGSFAVITRARNAARLQSKFMGSLDLSIRTKAFRAWLEGFAGNSTLFDGTETLGTLLALRVLIAPRIDEPLDGVRQIEPFVIFSALDPTDASDNDRALELGGGLAVWFRKRLRFQADVTYNAYEDQFPVPGVSFVDRTTIRLQLGSQFR